MRELLYHLYNPVNELFDDSGHHFAAV